MGEQCSCELESMAESMSMALTPQLGFVESLTEGELQALRW